MRVEVVGFQVGAPLGNACPCYAITSGETTILLDFGPGALERVWRHGLLEALDAIVISHMHLDHALDLLPLSGEVTVGALRDRHGDSWRPHLYVPREDGPRVLDALSRAIGSRASRFTDAFEVREYDDSDRVTIGALELSFALTQHTTRCYAARVSDGRSVLVYSADSAYTDTLVGHARGADAALLEATYIEPGPELARNGHMTGEQAAQLAREAGAGLLLLTHVGPSIQDNAENLRRAKAAFGGRVELVREGAGYELG